METPICPTCGCSLVRLGISREEATIRRHDGEKRSFCCKGCADLFIADAERYLRETSGWIVCPTCLAEKPPGSAVQLTIAGHELHFCRCPDCPEAFEREPDFYIQRLRGTTANEGSPLDHDGCCTRPLARES